MREFIKAWLGSPLIRFGSTLIAFCTLGILANFFEWAHYGLVGLSIIVGAYVGVMVIFAWIINPIRRWKNKNKE